jgi:putative transport protein
MEILRNLFYGFPDLWGGGVAHSVMILALVITLGLSLGKLKVKGVSLGLAWILFIGLIFGHYSLNLDAHPTLLKNSPHFNIKYAKAIQ